MGILFAVTAPLSPQTKATQAIFGAEEKELIKQAVKAYAETGKKGFLGVLQNGMAKLPRVAVDWVEEGLLKETPQELIQQGGETYVVNPSINRQAGKELKKETISFHSLGLKVKSEKHRQLERCFFFGLNFKKGKIIYNYLIIFLNSFYIFFRESKINFAIRYNIK